MNIIDAIINNDVEMVKSLLEEGVDPNMSLDESELRPLHFAAQNNCLEIGKLLITAGADIDVATVPDGETPLDVARLHGNKEFVDLLLAHKSGGEKIN